MTHTPFAAELAACRAAQSAWSCRTVRQRLRSVRLLRHLLVDRMGDLTAAVRADIGRPEAEILSSDLIPAAAALKFLEQEAERILKPRRIPGRLRPIWLMGCRDTVHRRPWGVVGIIGTWNYPLFLNIGPIAQAVAAGNGVLWKPSEFAPRTADLIGEMISAINLPRSLVTVLPATREAGKDLAATGVDHIVFTGSDTVGRQLATDLGRQLTPSTLELSGCDALFVLDDADILLAARAAWFGVSLNRGQTCIAVRRIFVHRGQYEAFVEAIATLLPSDQPRPLVSPAQVEQAARLVADGVAGGARVFRKADTKGGLSYPTTFLLDANPAMAICWEASFAPIAAVIPFDRVDEAIASCGESPFGLAASVFTADPGRGAEIAAKLRAGAVTVNDLLAPTAHPATPFGGRGSSGWGVTQGMEGLLAMTTPQTVTVRRGRFRPHYDEALSPNPATADLMRGLMRSTNGRTWSDRLRGVWQVIKAVRRR